MQPPPGPPPPGHPYGPPPGSPPLVPPSRPSLLWLWVTLGAVGVGVLIAGALLLRSGTDQAREYARRSKRTEAELNLQRIGKSARMEFIENGRVPPLAAPLTPARSCCGGPNHRCPVEPADWASEAWQTLDFEAYEPHFYRYAYQPTDDGNGFIATAIGDLDCDGDEVTYTLRGEIVNGDLVLSPIEHPARPD